LGGCEQSDWTVQEAEGFGRWVMESDRGLMILLVVLGLAFMLFVLFAGIVGLTP
jgi:hypothetical protein